MTRILALFVCFVFVVVPVVADDKKPAPLTGVWIVETAEMGGKPMTEHLKGMRYTVGDGKYTAKLGERTETGTYKLDNTKTPREMDTTPADGPLKDKTLLAIVEVDGDTLRVCYDRDGTERPKKFETTTDKPSVILMVFKREKK